MSLQKMKRELFDQIDKRTRLEKQMILCLFQNDKNNDRIIKRKFNEVEHEVMNKKYELEKSIGKAYAEKVQIEIRLDYLIQENYTDDMEILLARLNEINRDLETL